MSKTYKSEVLFHFVIATLAAILGAVNNLFVFTNDLELKGLLEFIIPLAYVVAIPGIGASFVPIKFFPRFEKEGIETKTLIAHTFRISGILLAAGFLLGLILAFLAELAGFSNPLVRLQGYYIEFILIAILTTVMQVLEKILSLYQKVAFPLFVKSFLNKLLMGGLFLMYVKSWITEEQVVHFLPMIYLIMAIALAISVKRSIKTTASSETFSLGQVDRKAMFVFGSYAMFMVLTASVSDKVTYSVLGTMASFRENGIFAINNYLASFIMIPYLAINGLFAPKISALLSEKKYEDLSQVYQDTSRMLLTTGLLLLLLVEANLSLLPMLSSRMAEVLEFEDVILILAAGYLVNMMFSINDQLISYSDHYRFNVITSSVLITSSVVLNIWLIPRYGIFGAAAANSGALILFNLTKSWFIIRKLGLKALTSKSIYLMGFGLISLMLILFLEDLSLPIWWNLILKNVSVGLLFLIPVAWFVAPEYLVNLRLSLEAWIGKSRKSH